MTSPVEAQPTEHRVDNAGQMVLLSTVPNSRLGAAAPTYS